MSQKQFRFRMFVAFISSMTGVFALLSFSDIGRFGGTGKTVFHAFVVCFGVVCWLSGIFLTSDCISREKREGTLGFLFLTDLTGKDVILGKLVSTSVLTFYTVLSAVPVMAMTFLMGGVTGTYLFRTSLVLLATMFLSLSTGMWVSTRSTKAGEAAQKTFLTMFGWTLVPILLGISVPGVAMISPLGLWWVADTASNPVFFAGVGLCLSVSVLQLVGASFRVKRVWQDTGTEKVKRSFIRRKKKKFRPVPLKDGNPIEWLVGGGQSRNIIPVVMMVIASVACFVLWPTETIAAMPIISAHVLPYFLAWSIVSRATASGLWLRRDGALELVLSTPLTDREIISGQWAALRRRYIVSAVLFLALIWLPIPDWHPYPDMDNISSDFNSWQGHIAMRAYVTLRCVLLWLAAGWAGIYFGLRARHPRFAGLQSLIIGVLMPWFAFCVPEPFITVVLIGVFRGDVTDHVRSSVARELEPEESD